MILRKNIVFIIILFSIVCLFIQPDFKSIMDTSLIYMYSALFLIIMIIHLFIEKSTFKGNWFRIDVIFLLGFLIVHFQWPIMYSFSRITPENIDRVWVNEAYVNYGVWLCLLGGLAWFLGYHISKLRPNRKETIFQINYRKLLNFTIVLFVLFLLTAGRNFYTGGIYKGYGGSDSGEGIAAYIQLLFSVCIIILTATIFIGNKHKYQGNLYRWILSLDKKFLLLISVYIILFLSIGDRGGPIQLMLAIIALISYFFKPVKLSGLIGLIAIGGIILTIIGIGRKIDDDGHTIVKGAKEFQLETPYETTLVLANSVRTLFYALEEVPENRDYFYGKLWVGGILGPVPFLNSIYLDLTNQKNRDINSSYYITYIVYGDNAPSGEGSSMMADIYLNFGSIGVFIVMFFVGHLLKRLNIELYNGRNYKWMIVAVIFSSILLSWNRGSFLQFIRPVIWSLIILKVMVTVRPYLENSSSFNRIK